MLVQRKTELEFAELVSEDNIEDLKSSLGSIYFNDNNEMVVVKTGECIPTGSYLIISGGRNRFLSKEEFENSYTIVEHRRLTDV